jgi:hypothetical protein
MTPSGSQPPKITRPRLVLLTLAAFAVVGLTLVPMYFFSTVLLGIPPDAAARYIGITGVLGLAAVAVGTYQNFKRYWPESAPPPRPRNQRVITALSLASLLVAAAAGGAAYAYAQQYMAVGVGLSTAEAIGGLLLVRRLREELRD